MHRDMWRLVPWSQHRDQGDRLWFVQYVWRQESGRNRCKPISDIILHYKNTKVASFVNSLP